MTKILPPGSTIGILGGGQLGRMLALAAATLGYRCHILTPEADSPASQVAAATLVAEYDDVAALDRFAAGIDVATYEFENIPTEAVDHLAVRVGVHPGSAVLRVTQDRVLEKDFVRQSGGGTADYCKVDNLAELDAGLARLGAPAILKTRRFGYDGKGQAKIDRADGTAAAWNALGQVPCILEAMVPFTCEISVIVARGQDGAIASYVPVENRHANHVLSVTLAPAAISPSLAAEARRIAEAIVAALQPVGVLTVEMFVLPGERLLVNELAPRVHNSGHWTIEACTTSQFEQHIRAVAGLPLGDPARHSNAVMHNLLGDEANDWLKILREPGAKLHLYGKAQARPGRKMGHVTRLLPLGETPKA